MFRDKSNLRVLALILVISLQSFGALPNAIATDVSTWKTRGTSDPKDWVNFNPYKFQPEHRLVPSPTLTPHSANVYVHGKPQFAHDPTRANVIYGRGQKSLPTMIYARAFAVLQIGKKYYQAPAAGESKHIVVNGESIDIYGTTVYTPLPDNSLAANPAQVAPFDPTRVFYKENEVWPSVIYARAGQEITIAGQHLKMPEAGQVAMVTVGADGRIKQAEHNSATPPKHENAEGDKNSSTASGGKGAAQGSGSAGSASSASGSSSSATAAEKAAVEKAAAEKAASAKAASEKTASQKSASEKAASEKEIAEKAASEKAAAEKAASEKTAAEKAASEKAASEKAAAEKAAAEKAAAEKAVAEKAAAEKAAAEKAAAEKAAAEKAAAEKAAAEKAAAEKAAAEKAAAEKAAAEKAAAEKAAAEKAAAEKAAADKAAADKAAADKAAAPVPAPNDAPGETNETRESHPMYSIVGEWALVNTHTTNQARVKIEQTGATITATVTEQGNGYIPTGKVRFSGEYRSNPFEVTVLRAYPGFTSPYNESGTLTVSSINNLTIVARTGNLVLSRHIVQAPAPVAEDPSPKLPAPKTATPPKDPAVPATKDSIPKELEPKRVKHIRNGKELVPSEAFVEKVRDFIKGLSPDVKDWLVKNGITFVAEYYSPSMPTSFANTSGKVISIQEAQYGQYDPIKKDYELVSNDWQIDNHLFSQGRHEIGHAMAKVYNLEGNAAIIAAYAADKKEHAAEVKALAKTYPDGRGDGRSTFEDSSSGLSETVAQLVAYEIAGRNTMSMDVQHAFSKTSEVVHKEINQVFGYK